MGQSITVAYSLSFIYEKYFQIIQVFSYLWENFQQHEKGILLFPHSQQLSKWSLVVIIED